MDAQPVPRADAVQLLYNYVVADREIKKSPNLDEYLRMVRYTPSVKKPPIIPLYPLENDAPHITMLKLDLVGAILVHLGINYTGYKFVDANGKPRTDDEVYKILEHFFSNLARAIKGGDVSVPALVQISMMTKVNFLMDIIDDPIVSATLWQNFQYA